MPCVVQVFWKPHARPPGDDRLVFALIEVGLADFQQVCLAIDEDRLIGGERLTTHRTEERGVRRVVKRDPIAFRGGAVDRVDLPTYRLIEEGPGE